MGPHWVNGVLAPSGPDWPRLDLDHTWLDRTQLYPDSSNIPVISRPGPGYIRIARWIRLYYSLYLYYSPYYSLYPGFYGLKPCIFSAPLIDFEAEDSGITSSRYFTPQLNSIGIICLVCTMPNAGHNILNGLIFKYCITVRISHNSRSSNWWQLIKITNKKGIDPGETSKR